MVTWEQISMKWGCRDKGWNKGNRDEWRGVGDVMEIEWTWGGESVVEERWHRTNFVGDPSGIQYLTNTLCYTLDSQHLNISTQPGPSVSFIMPGTMLSKGPLQPVLPRLPNTIIRPRLQMHTSWAWVCFQSLNGFTSHILISITVIHPEYELVNFEKHWGKDLTAQVTQMVQELISYHKSSINTYDYSNVL